MAGREVRIAELGSSTRDWKIRDSPPRSVVTRVKLALIVAAELAQSTSVSTVSVKPGSRLSEMTPGLAVGDLLYNPASFQLAKRVTDRGEGDSHAFLTLERRANLGRTRGTRRNRLQHFLDQMRVTSPAWMPFRRCRGNAFAGTAARLACLLLRCRRKSPCVSS